jgi:hypothetical protein
MRENLSYGHQTAGPITRTRLVVQPQAHRSELSILHQGGAVIQERSKTNVKADKKLETSSVMIPAFPTRYSPRSQQPMRSKARTNPPRSRQVAMTAINQTAVPQRHAALSIQKVENAL